MMIRRCVCVHVCKRVCVRVRVRVCTGVCERGCQMEPLKGHKNQTGRDQDTRFTRLSFEPHADAPDRVSHVADGKEGVKRHRELCLLLGVVANQGVCTHIHLHTQAVLRRKVDNVRRRRRRGISRNGPHCAQELIDVLLLVRVSEHALRHALHRLQPVLHHSLPYLLVMKTWQKTPQKHECGHLSACRFASRRTATSASSVKGPDDTAESPPKHHDAHQSTATAVRWWQHK
jgi:hypothetical protein